MSTFLHTPGPWHIRHGLGPLKAEIGPDHHAVASVFVKEWRLGDPADGLRSVPAPWADGLANAALIARAAIAKATGSAA